LLTPGPYNETYFEHSYLARYLGFTLVQGGDLTVRGNRVFLKSLEGLKPVDVILRRVDDGFCDPLELRSESFLGVAGLVDAVRAGNVAVANALGSGLIETSAFMPFLPGLATHLLGEKLVLPSVATWWCGQESAQRYVRENLPYLVLKPAFPSFGKEPVFGGQLSPGEREQLVEKIRARPYDYAGQELLSLSATPVWSEGQLTPRKVVLRVYLAAWPAYRPPLKLPSSPCSGVAAAKIPGSSLMHRSTPSLFADPPAILSRSIGAEPAISPAVPPTISSGSAAIPNVVSTSAASSAAS
jgi:uncharacterized circularly permuted ATP-grasp superfamily protein